MSNRRSILLLLFGCLLLAAAHMFMSYHGVGGALVQRATLAGDVGAAADSVTIARPGAPDLVLVKEDGWSIKAPFRARADESGVLELLDALSFGRISHSFTRQDLEQFGRTPADYGLAEPSARVVVAAGGGAVAVSIGDVTPTRDGVFAQVDGDPSVYIVETNLLAAATMPAEGFRERSLCPAGVELVDAFDIKRGKGVLLRFVRRDAIWSRVSSRDGSVEAPASAVKVKELLAALSAAKAFDFAWPVGSPDEPATPTATLLAGYGLDADTAVTVTLHSHGRPDQQVSFGKAAGDGRVYALVQNAGAVATVAGSLRDIAGAADFSDMRLFPYEQSAVSRLSVTDNGVNYLLARGVDGRWHMDAPVAVDADETSVAAFVSRLVSLTYADRDPEGLVVSLATNTPPETVSRVAALAGLQLADLRSREMLRFDPADIHRIAVTPRGASRPATVVFDKDRRSWIVESSERPATIVQSSIDGLVAAICPLQAEKVVKLKVSPVDLRRYGLETPNFTIAVDSSKDGALRRNILIGEKSQGGCFAALGAFDAVFVLSDETVRRLTAPLVTE